MSTVIDRIGTARRDTGVVTGLRRSRGRQDSREPGLGAGCPSVEPGEVPVGPSPLIAEASPADTEPDVRVRHHPTVRRGRNGWWWSCPCGLSGCRAGTRARWTMAYVQALAHATGAR